VCAGSGSLSAGSTHFASPAEKWHDDDSLATSSYIYAKFWKDYMNELYSPSTKIVKVDATLDISDMLKFGFKDFVVIDHTLYMVNSIENVNFSNDEPVKLELVTVNDIDAYTKGQTLSWS